MTYPEGATRGSPKGRGASRVGPWRSLSGKRRRALLAASLSVTEAKTEGGVKADVVSGPRQGHRVQAMPMSGLHCLWTSSRCKHIGSRDV